jgi:hypothetical protein
MIEQIYHHQAISANQKLVSQHYNLIVTLVQHICVLINDITIFNGYVFISELEKDIHSHSTAGEMIDEMLARDVNRKDDAKERLFSN